MKTKNEDSEENLGIILREIESLEKFYPCYVSMMKNK